MMPDERDGSTRQHGAESGTATLLAENGFYRAMASSQRRHLLSFLLGTPETTVEELAAVLAGWEAVGTGRLARRSDHERVTVALVHAHLPVLEDAGLLRYDRETGTVELASLDDEVAALIRRSVAAEGAGT